MSNRGARASAVVALVLTVVAVPRVHAQSPVIVVEQPGQAAQPMQQPMQAQDPNAGMAYYPQQQPQPQPQMVLVEPFSQPRVRGGFTVFGGPAVPSGATYSSGGLGGASGRIGVQINRQWGVYYHGQAVVGGYAYVTPTTSGGAIFAAYYNTFAASFTLFDRLEFGFGPSIDRLAVLSTSVDTGSGGASASGFAGTGVGLHGRISIAVGAMYPEYMRRSGFTFSLDLHPTFIDGGVLFTTGIGIGAEWF